MTPSKDAARGKAWLQRWRRDLGVIILLGVLTVLFFWPYLTPVSQDRLHFPDGDFTRQFYAYRVLAYRSFSQGEVPLWSPCLFSGYPFQADPQSSLFYPPTLLLHGALLAAGVQEYPLSALVFEVVLHVFLAAAFTYLFLRSQVRRPAAALLGALVFGFGGFLTGYPLLQVAILEGVTWLPLALFGIDRFYRTTSWRFLVLGAVSVALSLLAGHPQTSFFLSIAVLAYSIFAGWREGAAARRIVTATLGLALGAAALSAIQWLPSWELLQHSTRATGPAETGGGFPFGDLVQFLVVGVVSLWHPLYVGILPLLLALFAWVGRRRWDPNLLFWTALALVALLLSFGDRLFIYDLARRFVPGYGLFRGPERHALLVAFALSILAAWGADALFASFVRIQRRQLGAVLLLGGLLSALVALALGSAIYSQSTDTLMITSLAGSLILLALALGVLGLRRWLPGSRPWVVGAALAVVVLDLFSQNQGVNASGPYELYPMTPVVRPMVEDRGLFRMQDDFRLAGHTACMLGLKETIGMSPLRLGRYEAFLDQVPERIRLDLLAVRYIVSWRGQIITPEGDLVETEILYDDGEGTALHRILEPRSWAFVAETVEVVDNEQEVLARLSDPDFDPQQLALVEEPLPFPEGEGSGSAEVITHQPHEVVMRAEMDQPGLLVVKEVFYPGWSAYVDGGPVPIYRVDAILRGVPLEAGSHEVRIVYEPFTFRLGALVSGTAWILLGAAMTWMALRRRWSVGSH